MSAFQQPLPPPPPTPEAPPAPAAAGRATAVVGGTPIPLEGVPRTREQLRDLRARRSELSDQLTSAVGRRNTIAQRLRTADGADRVGLEQRLRLLDERILQLEADIALTGRQAAAATVAGDGEARPPGPPWDRGDFGERASVGIAALFTLFVLAPLAIATARRIWRRAVYAAPPRDTETAQRLMRLETAVDTIAIEVERVAEGQRFLTRMLAESNGMPRFDAIPASHAAHDPALVSPTLDLPITQR